MSINCQVRLDASSLALLVEYARLANCQPLTTASVLRLCLDGLAAHLEAKGLARITDHEEALEYLTSKGISVKQALGPKSTIMKEIASKALAESLSTSMADGNLVANAIREYQK